MGENFIKEISSSVKLIDITFSCLHREEVKDKVHFQVAPHQETPPKEAEEHHGENNADQNPLVNLSAFSKT
jgi:hypothetical protein